MELRDLETFGEPGAVVYLADCMGFTIDEDALAVGLKMHLAVVTKMLGDERVTS